MLTLGVPLSCSQRQETRSGLALCIKNKDIKQNEKLKIHISFVLTTLVWLFCDLLLQQ